MNRPRNLTHTEQQALAQEGLSSASDGSMCLRKTRSTYYVEGVLTDTGKASLIVWRESLNAQEEGTSDPSVHSTVFGVLRRVGLRTQRQATLKRYSQANVPAL